MRTLLFIDSSYTLTEIRERALSHVLNIRHLNGYWDHVISAHPLDMRGSTVGTESRFGRTKIETLDESHRFARGRLGRFAALSRLSFLNSLLALVDFWAALIKLVRKDKIDAVRSGDPLLCGVIGLVISRLARVGFVVRIPANNDMIRASTGKPTQSRFTRSIAVEKWIEKLVVSRADVIIAPSENYADFAISKGASREKIMIVRYGGMVDPSHQVLPRDRPSLRDPYLLERLSERKWMFHIGRLSEIKHIEDCFDVLDCLSANGMDTGLLLIGDGPLRETLEARVKASGKTDRVMFLGNLPQQQLIALLPYASVVLSPLTGRALAEAAFAASPIVAYDLDWQGDLIRSDETGILVPARDTTAMAAGAQRFLDDSKFARQMGDEVRERAIALLSPDVAFANEVAAYESLNLRPNPVSKRQGR